MQYIYIQNKHQQISQKLFPHGRWLKVHFSTLGFTTAPGNYFWQTCQLRLFCYDIPSHYIASPTTTQPLPHYTTSHPITQPPLPLHNLPSHYTTSPPTTQPPLPLQPPPHYTTSPPITQPPPIQQTHPLPIAQLPLPLHNLPSHYTSLPFYLPSNYTTYSLCCSQPPKIGTDKH